MVNIKMNNAVESQNETFTNTYLKKHQGSLLRLFISQDIFLLQNSLRERNLWSTFKGNFFFEEQLHEKLYQVSPSLDIMSISMQVPLRQTEASHKIHENKK